MTAVVGHVFLPLMDNKSWLHFPPKKTREDGSKDERKNDSKGYLVKKTEPCHIHPFDFDLLLIL